MKIFILIAIAFFFSLNAYSFEFLISGKISNSNGEAKFTAYTTANPDVVYAKINRSGEFSIKGSFPVPTRMMLSYEDDSLESSYELFLFESDTIDVQINAQTGDWNLTGVSPLSENSYEHASTFFRIFRNKYGDTDSTFNLMEDSLITFLGGDDLAKVAAKSFKLFYMNLMVTREMERIYDIYEMDDLVALPKNEQAYSGMMWYNQVIVDYNMKNIVDSLKQGQQDSNYSPQFHTMLSEIEKREAMYPFPIYLDMKSRSFYYYDDAEASENERRQYITTLEKFLKTYPDYVNNASLESRLNSVKYSLVKKSAPVFELVDTNGISHKFPQLNGKYILLDVWGSWCAPCRFYNKHLVKMYYEMKDSLPIEFVSIAYDQNLEEWKNAIRTDSLAWQQLLYTDEFVKSYNITVFPTMYLISPEGIVLKKSTQIREDDILEIVKN
ncbi:MAG: TlpA disulfide reductase family protein [Bacteroidia bacterium]